MNIQDSSELCCAMQLYHSSHHNLALLQIRSGLLPGSSAVFSGDLVTWARSQGVSRVICLTSSMAHERQESQLTGTNLRYITTKGADKDMPDNFVKLEPRQSLHGQMMDSGHNEVIGSLARKLETYPILCCRCTCQVVE